MSPQIETKILEKLNKIEDLLIQIIPQKSELTEEDVLKGISESSSWPLAHPNKAAEEI